MKVSQKLLDKHLISVQIAENAFGWGGGMLQNTVTRLV